MRRFLIAALLGAPLLIAGPALAAVGKTEAAATENAFAASASGPSLGLMTPSSRDRLALDSKTAPAGPVLAHESRSNPLWWLQAGIGDRWDDDDRWRRDRWKKDRWHRSHPWYKRHDWKKGRWYQHSRRWDRDRDWDRRHRHWDDHDRRRRDHDWDRGHRDHGGDYRWGDDRRDR